MCWHTIREDGGGCRCHDWMKVQFRGYTYLSDKMKQDCPTKLMFGPTIGMWPRRGAESRAEAEMERQGKKDKASFKNSSTLFVAIDLQTIVDRLKGLNSFLVCALNFQWIFDRNSISFQLTYQPFFALSLSLVCENYKVPPGWKSMEFALNQMHNRIKCSRWWKIELNLIRNKFRKYIYI